MALLTHKVSTCTDNYSLFAKEKSFYGIPYIDRSRSTIPSDASSFFSGALSLHSAQDLSTTIPSRNAKNDTARSAPDDEEVETPRDDVDDNDDAAKKEAPAPLLESAIMYRPEDHSLPHYIGDFDDDENAGNRSDNNGGSSPTDNASFVTANSGRMSAHELPDFEEAENAPYVFHKWMKTMLRKSSTKNRRHRANDVAGTPMESGASSIISCETGLGTTTSSNRFVTAVRTASTTLASFPMSGHTTSRRGNGSTALDPDTIARMLDRKHALEELITTEEYYIRDLKSLKDKYLPILRDCVWISSDVRQVMARNVAEMLELHGRLLADITRALPCTTQMVQDYVLDPSADIGDTKYPLLSDPAAAAEVAKAFDATIMAFFVYEEYSAKYQEVIKAPKRIGKSDLLHGKGTEALIGASNSWDNRGDYGKRAMELYDLLFKPIQRLCKYPLIFRDIEKNCPAIDCPDTNRLLEKVRHRLDEAVHQVNMANSDSPKIRERIGKTWLLQDRLDFQEKSLPARLLGHVILCGTLHITWQSNRESQPHTEYMACMLFKSYLILASVPKPDHYKVKFAITLAVARIEEPNHGKSLYSPGAPHTFKLVFEANHRVFEILCSACSDEEETVWRDQIQDRILTENKDYQEYSSTNMDFCSGISPDIKPVGDVFGRPGTFARHQSLIRGGVSTSLESDGQYVVINNFLFVNDINGSTSLKRNYSALNFNGLVPTVNLKRTDRNRVETKLADVWTKDLIPFNATRSKPEKEPSGTMVMRRLSMLSLLSGGSKRSVQSNGSSSLDSPWEDDADYSDNTMRRSATHSFSKAKSDTYKSAPPSPTKRSSSLSSRFSFTSSIKKEGACEKISPNNSKRRSKKPLIDTKWRSNSSESEGVIVEATTAELLNADDPEPWERGEGYFSIVKKTTTPPNSVKEEELDIRAALGDDYMKKKAGPLSHLRTMNKSVPGAISKTMQQNIERRHTMIAPPRSRSMPWISSRRKNPKTRSESAIVG